MEMDAIISESGTQLLSRLEKHKSINFLEPALFPPHLFEASGTAIEINGAAASGKSELLLNFVRNCIMPVAWHDKHIGGLEIGVIFMDIDRHFHLPRLVSSLKEAWHTSSPESRVAPQSERQANAFITACLSRLYIVSECNNSSQFILTLQFISANLCVKYGYSALFIDSISAFYYEDRMVNLEDRNRLGEHHKRLAAILRELLENDKFTIVFTKQDFVKSRKTRGTLGSESSGHFHPMGNDLEKLVAWKLSLHKVNDSSIIKVDIQYKKNQWKNCFDILEKGICFKNTDLTNDNGNK